MSDRTITITFRGPLADAGSLDVAFVLPVVEGFSDAFRRMIRHQHALLTGRRPPYPALLSASALRLAAIGVGSYSVALEIDGPMALGELADAPVDPADRAVVQRRRRCPRSAERRGLPLAASCGRAAGRHRRGGNRRACQLAPAQADARIICRRPPAAGNLPLLWTA